MNKLLLICLLVIVCLPHFVFGAELNAGFVQGLWYSQEEIFVGEPVRIYAALRNNSSNDLSGTVRFTIDGRRFDNFSVSALPGRLVEAWTDWTPTPGEHTIKATFIDVKLHKIGESAEAVEVVDTLAEDTIFVDFDTDSDGIGNTTDPDDDNDGVSDEDEIAAGTDPLVVNKKPEPKEAEAAQDELNEAAEGTTETAENAVSSTKKQGLEQYIGEGTVQSLFSNVTEKVHEAKNSIDAYREKRRTDIGEMFTGSSTTTANTLATETGTTATITRTKAEPKASFVESVIGAGASLLGGVYTFVLWFLSGFLSYPALVQLLLLIGILVIVYKVARRLGGRPPGY